MAFSMKLKPGKKPVKPVVNPMAQGPKLFSMDERPPELSRRANLPPPPAPMLAVVNQSKSDRAVQEALASDPNAFDYDGVYESMQAERVKQKAAKKVQGVPQSKYINVLMEKAKVREIEHDRIRERRLLKEREEDDKIHGDKEKFITSSYKRKLMEAKRWEEEDARLAAIEDAQDVTKRGELGMAGFYANLLTNNIAMGGDVEKATSAYTTGHISEAPKRQKIDAPQESTTPVSDAKPAAKPTVEDAPVDMPANDTIQEEVPAAPVKKSREDLIREARERYLARKQQDQPH
ncbi:hypothetical protein SPRG_05329 [Saprolegnia parasitica CBS 223.65]|uniref:Nuclear speckle splicing regulatory protein 1 N-terminal domain-containing protein n=1 Tax=Saprolegnia parasitica (strain CBS 223.65) TaxID=695850 RepID=A0A067CTN4_SAPPC|nr:hypothetical protein SPRG_05329 [Saprolegnia parasitica CBS 223.65]KDO30137.1 hypothetical protein SPRG_05329 [Saprolegnia parasitica CBS 223.65]|eukprot:XP_012199315.1 hypothetical protein SPRG_05329 [Saprolegnia parasitica CBS 223.65]